MATLGDMLRSARETKGISLADAERDTKIRQKYISALEDDNVLAMPGPTYARGFLRNYAGYLGLDADETIHLFDEQSQPTRDKIRVARGGSVSRPTNRPNTDRINIQPLSHERIDTRVRYGTQYIALSLLAIPLLIVFYFVYSAYAGPKSESPPIPTVLARIATVTPMPATTVIVSGPATGEYNVPTVFVPPTPVAVTAQQPITATAVTTASSILTGTTPPLTPVAAANITVKVIITQDAWMSVIVDGVQQFAGTLPNGATRQWKGKNTIQLRTGRADAVRAIVNGQDRGLMGSPTNQVVEKRWDKSGSETVIQP